MIYSHIADAIKKPHFIHLRDNLYIARFESMKIYSTLAAVKSLLERGLISQNDTLLDSSSGIYAYALALACNKYGLKCHIIASKTVDPVLKLQLELLGAIVEPAKSAANLKMDQENRVKRIQEILSKRSNVHWMQQYHDDIHYLGYQEFSTYIAESFPQQALTLVGGVGSGCSTGATAKFLRKLGRNVTLHGVQPFGSVTFDSEHVEDPDIIIAGIGSSIEFRNVRAEFYDYIHWISFDYSRHGAIEMLKEYGVFAGLSAGSCYTVASWCAPLIEKKQPCIFIAADMGHRYFDPVFKTHQDAKPVTTLFPTLVNDVEQLQLNWCAMPWQRKSFTDKKSRAKNQKSKTI
ncbi:pyridoxal-phosphate dependent enzyme [Thalassotalea ganghwensis]